ncbi:MAG: tetratricopeptide repeat protein, partial [Cyanobacteria bacterium]|nr:tetratricopeptide repeat protein [Cyanobacteriota bacterium]
YDEAEILAYDEERSTEDDVQDASWGEWGETDTINQEIPDEAAAPEQPWTEQDWTQELRSYDDVDEQVEEPQQYDSEEEESEEEMSSTKALRAACSTVITADSSMENKNYRVALPLYAKALKLFRDEEATANADFAHCLEKFGDCNFHRGNFEEALNAYREYDALFSRVEYVPDQLKVVALLKLGKTSHKMKRFADSEAAYELAITIANSTLPPVHPLIPLIYQSYVSMLRARGADQFKIDKLESDYEARVKDGADDSNVPPDLRAALNPWIEPDANELENIVKSKQSQNRQQQNLKSTLIQDSPSTLRRYTSRVNPVAILIAIIGTSVLVLAAAFIFLGTNLLDQNEQAGGKSGKSALAKLTGKIYTSTDGLKTIEFKNSQTVIYKCGAQKVTIPFLAGTPDKSPLADLKRTILGKKSCIFKKVSGGFEDPQGTTLYEEDSKDLKIVKRMRHLMKEANSFYKKNSQYPRKLEDFATEATGEETSDDGETLKKPRFDVFQFEKYEGSVAFKQKLSEFDSGSPFFSVDKKQKASPGLIECLSVVPFDFYLKEDGISFFVRAYDSKGHFLSASLPGQVYVLVSKNGHHYKPIKAAAVKPVVTDAEVEKTTAYFELNREAE